MATRPSPEITANHFPQPDEQPSAEVISLSEYRQEPSADAEVPAINMPMGGGELIQPVDGSVDPELIYPADLRRIKAARSDPARFDALLGEYKGFVRFIASGYFLAGGETDDLVQEAMFGFYKGVRDYDGRRSSFRSFVELCMKRQVITAVKAATRQKHQPLNECVSFSQTLSTGDGEGATLGDLIPDKGRSPEDIVVGRETFHGLLDILTGELSYLEYSVLKLYLEGEPYETIAEELAEDPKVVDNALQRVKRKAQEYLGIQR